MRHFEAYSILLLLLRCLAIAEKMNFCEVIRKCDNQIHEKSTDYGEEYVNAKILEQIIEAESRLDEKLARLEAKMSQLTDYTLPRSCKEVQNSEAFSPNENVFNISLTSPPMSAEVSCDQSTDDGGWIVFQRRMDGSEDFYRNWDEYVTGFGDREREFWLGLENIHQIVKRGNYELRIDMEDWEGQTAYAKYGIFNVDDASTNYRLHVGQYTGTAGDSLGSVQHQDKEFTTKDVDNDVHAWGNCAEMFKGGFWYATCHEVNLNGLYIQGGKDEVRGRSVIWYRWKGHYYSLKSVEMKMREKI